MENTTHTKEDLKMMQSLPLSIKVRMTEERIRQWYQYWGGNVCVSFSGGKDSTVLMHIARGLYPDIPAVFSNTGLEYPEIQRFVKEYGNVDVVTPSMKFVDVVTQYGYPLIGKEVAEAIYYARRIRSQTGNVERERERERTAERKQIELFGMREAERRRGNLTGAERSNAGSTSQDNANFRAGGRTKPRRIGLLGRRDDSGRQEQHQGIGEQCDRSGGTTNRGCDGEGISPG